jgi:nucleoside-diphosphate-sugar epimerase
MQLSKMAVTDQPIKVFNNGNMPAPVKYEVNFTGPVPLVPWTYFSPLGWNAKQIPPGLSRGRVSVHWGVRDFTYVDDIVEGVIRVIDNPPKISNKKEIDVSISNTAPYKVYNIGNSSPIQLMEYIGAIEQTLNKKAEKEFLPMQQGDVPKTEADVADLMENLNYKPETPVQTGINQFIDWYKSYFGIQ